MGETSQQHFLFFLTGLLGLWHITDDMRPDQIMAQALTKWKTPSTALEHILHVKSPSLNMLQAACLLWSSIQFQDQHTEVQTLRTLLECFPVEMRAAAFEAATNSDTIRQAYLLTTLLPSAPPGLAAVAKKVAQQWAFTGPSDDLALNFYQSLEAYGAPQLEVQWFIARAFVTRSHYAQAEPLLLELAQKSPSPEVWWHLALVFQALHRSPQQCLWALNCFIRSAPLDPRTVQALGTIGDLYYEFLNENTGRDANQYLHTLRELLAFFPESLCAEALALITAKRDEAFLAQILTFLPLPKLPGLSSTVRSILARWEAEPRSDDLAIHFYRSLPAYGIAELDALLLLVKAFINREQYGLAEAILTPLATLHAVPDVLWYLTCVYQALDRPSQMQLQALLDFIRNVPDDSRIQQALSRLGVVFSTFLDTNQATSAAVLYLSQLCYLLASFPVHSQAAVFDLITNHDETFASRLLCSLPSPALPGLTPRVKTLLAAWRTEPRSDDLAMLFYDKLPSYGIPEEEAHLLLARACIRCGQTLQAEHLLKKLAITHPSPDVLWYLASVYRELQHPPQLQFEAWLQFVVSAPADKRTLQALQTIGIFFKQLCNSSKSFHEASLYLKPLRTLLESFPESKRVEVLHLIVEHDDFQALILSFPGTPAIAGLAPVARDIKTRWEIKLRSDELALHFYRSLPGYGVLQDEVLFLLARTFIARKEFTGAEQTLLELVSHHPSPDALWYLAYVYHELRRPPQTQHDTLVQFVESAPTHEHAGLAWKMIGDLRGEQLGDGMAAIFAYQQAVESGQSVPRLAAFYAGEWDAIPALRHHADYPFPVVVALDLEVDPAQKLEAKPGSRVFEVAAVRYKGQTCLEHYSAYIHRDFCPAKWDKETAEARLRSAPSEESVAYELNKFIGNAIVVGHNLRAFDAPELAGMGVPIAKENVIDTLLLARLLHPDSLYHHLAILCQTYNIVVDQASLHSALPDAQACVQLFHALGESLSRRETDLLTGIRAMVTPDSAFDKAILQPRNIAADPTLAWHCNATPALPRSISPLRGTQASPAMQQALQASNDQFVEHADFDARYATSLSTTEHTLVTVGSHTRIERLLTHHRHSEKIFVLPNPQTLLCPRRVRQAIETCSSSEQRLLLFCLYQASHNHDAATLYPLRLPQEALSDSETAALRQTLMEACCVGDSEHDDSCPARLAVASAIETHPILLCTHETLFRQSIPVQADTIVIDDVVHLQMKLAEYCATTLTSDQAKVWLRSPEEQAILSQLEGHIQDWAIRYLPTPGYHERLPLSSFTAYLSQDKGIDLTSFLSNLKQVGKQGEKVAILLEDLFGKALQKPRDGASTHAYWIDLWFEHKGEHLQLQSWHLCGISQDLRQSFQRQCWQPYKKHLLAGPALSTGGRNITFLQRNLGIAGNLPYQQDPHPRKRIYLPIPEIIPAAGLLQRRKWIVQVGALIASKVQGKQRTILVTLNNRTALEALLQTFQQTRATAGRQLLATQLKWTVTKINERIRDPARQSLVFASPGLRQTLLDSAVDLEISGPLRFLNRHDPLVIAHMQVFSHLYPEEGPFKAYLLPQALLELQSRLTSDANECIICDGGLLSKSYRDEVLQILREHADVRELTRQDNPAGSTQFLTALSTILAQHGLEQHVSISDADLSLILRSVWDTDTFREFPSLEGDSRSPVTQKDVVRTVLDEKDQLVIAATGGGKSLCFQLPAIILAEETTPKVTLVFSPLIALMSNQVEQLNRKGIFSAIMLNSTLSIEQRQEHLEGISKGYYSIIYLAPEQIYSKKLRQVLQSREIGLIAIDEAHCLSQWGHNFRTDYFAIKKWIDKTLCSGREREFPLLALTATARQGYKDTHHTGQSDQASTVTDIIEKLGLRINENEVVLSSAIRPELEFHFAYITPVQSCTKCKHTYEYQTDIGACPACGYRPRATKHEVQQTVAELKRQRLLSLLSPDPQQKRDELPDLYPRWSQPLGQRQRGLIYCAYQKTTAEIAAFLRKEIPGLRVAAYHAGMDNVDRDDILNKFTSDTEQGLDVVACTNAFGMGIDVRRLGFVIHFDTPATPEAYYQEAGRAGRDRLFQKEKAPCILLFHPSDLEKQRFLSSQNSFTDYEIEDVYSALCAIHNRDQEYIFPANFLEPRTTSLTGQSRHIYASVQEIAERAGVQEERVNTLLYYLEYQTKDKIHHQPVLERGAYASNIWQLSFARDYQARLQELPSDSASWLLVKAFQNQTDYRLSAETFSNLSARELANCLHLSLKDIEAELLNLVRRGIIHYKGSGQFKLNDPLPVLNEKLHTFEHDLQELLRVIDSSKRSALSRNEQVTVNIRSLMSAHNLNTVTLSQLTHFLFRHALEPSEPLRLFELFRRVTRNAQPDHYELQLWRGRDREISVCTTIHEIITQLVNMLDVLASRMKDTGDKTDWYVFDVFEDDLRLDYRKRRRFHQQMLLLETLGLLKYRSDPALGQALELTLLQTSGSKDSLEIDLQSLRLQESYAKSKRKLMEQYATLTQKEYYAQQFARYFQGEKPLLEHNQHELWQDLTQQQRAVATLINGTHVIEGPAGCGKTKTLAEHVKHLINQQVPIDHIMITTHYTSAEGHIAEALKELESEGATAISTTINAFGNKIFQHYRTLLRRPDGMPYYRNADTPQPLKNSAEAEEELRYINQALKLVATRDFANLVFEQHWLWPKDLELPHFSPNYRSNAVEEDRFLAAIHRLRQYGIFPTTPPSGVKLTQIIGEQTGIYSVSEFYAVYMAFIEVLAEHNLCTFDDQIVFALAILHTHPEILHEYQRYFEHIIIDELQDFSPAKVELLMLLCEKHDNIMAFGDIFQEVMFDKLQGNGENVKISAETVFSRLTQRDTCNPGNAHQLMVNFRSTQEILDFTTFIRSKAITGNRMVAPLQSWQNKHGVKPTYLYTDTNTVPELLEVALDQIGHLSASEQESVVLIFGGKEMLRNAQSMLTRRTIPYSLMDGQKTLYQLHYVKNILLYLYLIEDKTRDDETERLLRYNIVPYIDRSQLLTLKRLASREGMDLFAALTSTKQLRAASISKEQEERLRHHLALIDQSSLKTPVSQLEQALRELNDGPLTLLQEQEGKLSEVESILKNLRALTIQEALIEIRRHITFLDKHQGRSDLVLATVDYAKSQEFETVFLLGLNKVYGKRLYVSVSRAKQRLFLVGDETAFAKHRTLSEMPRKLYTTVNCAKALPL